jgi:hypothetical protein
MLDGFEAQVFPDLRRENPTAITSIPAHLSGQPPRDHLTKLPDELLLIIVDYCLDLEGKTFRIGNARTPGGEPRLCYHMDFGNSSVCLPPLRNLLGDLSTVHPIFRRIAAHYFYKNKQLRPDKRAAVAERLGSTVSFMVAGHGLTCLTRR